MTGPSQDPNRGHTELKPEETIACYSLNQQDLAELILSKEPDATVEQLRNLSFLEHHFARHVRNEAMQAIDDCLASPASKGEKLVISDEHEPGLRMAINEIAMNALWYSYAGLTSAQKRQVVQDGGNTSAIDSPEPKDVTLSFELKNGILLVTVSGGYPPPSDFADRWENSILVAEDKQGYESSPSSGILTAEELEALLHGAVSLADNGGRGLTHIALVFDRMRSFGNSITYSCNLLEYFSKDDSERVAA